jgi:23S rRNA pseudouridine1911/1915/1917 synthase
MAEPLVILFEDAHCLAAAKPAGVLTQGPPSGEATLEAAVRRHLCPDDPASVYLGTVHRLDRPVSGVILWAKTPKAARRLAEQFSRREARKEYWAVVQGTPATGQGLWDDWLCLDDATGLGVVQVCLRGAPRAKQAITRFQQGQADRLPSGCSWLRLWPETGRTHQIRVQAGSRGLPILGDRAYGSAVGFAHGIALHSRALTVHHPVLRQPITFEAQPPEQWSAQGIALPTTRDKIGPLPGM